MAEEKAGYGKGYGKRPLWQWILIYIVVGGILYFLVYKFFLAPKGGYNYSPSSTSQSQQKGAYGY
jgi:hypothetical protein